MAKTRQNPQVPIRTEDPRTRPKPRQEKDERPPRPSPPKATGPSGAGSARRDALDAKNAQRAPHRPSGSPGVRKPERSQAAPTKPKPAPEKSKPAPATKDGRYVVKRGDNLSTIARKHGTTLAKVLELNPRLRKNPDLIFRGTKVRLK